MILTKDLEKLSLALKQGPSEGCYRVSGGGYVITLHSCPSSCDALDIFLSIAAQNEWQFATVRVIKESDPQ